MIACLAGTVCAVGLEHAVVMVGGVGLAVRATPATLAPLRVGQPTELATSLVVREDSLTLYGFADADERDIFEAMQSVSGIGPRIALAMLAVHTPDALRRAVATEDLSALTRVPGVGKKSAQRIVLELANKLGAPTQSDAPSAPIGNLETEEQLVAALTGLGWPTGPAQQAAQTAVAAQPAADVATLLRAALQSLGGARRG